MIRYTRGGDTVWCSRYPACECGGQTGAGQELDRDDWSYDTTGGSDLSLSVSPDWHAPVRATVDLISQPAQVAPDVGDVLMRGLVEAGSGQ